MVNVFMVRLRSLNREGPSGFLSPSVIPPLGPNPGVDRICGDEIECFKLLRCNIVGTPGESNGSTDNESLFAAPVFRLSKLGFFRAFKGGGFINDGDEGSDA
jgi:hypothetical protein